MTQLPDKSFLSYIEELEDPRIDRKKLYPLSEVLLIVLTAVICGAEGWEDIADFGLGKLEYLRKFLPFENGAPSHDTIRRVMINLNPGAFESCFISWVKSLRDIIGEVIAVDGKTVRRSHKRNEGKEAIHMVSAFAANARLVLGQKKTRDKSNEITAIPELLNLLDISSSIITIDAMGCQKEIAKIIIDKKADYILALKGNQGTLYEDVALFLQGTDYSHATCEKTDAGHGRIEIRKAKISSDVSWLKPHHNWQGLSSIAMIESTRIIGDKETKETRYYITSLPQNAELFLDSVRSHWAIENSLHWTLDMTLREDESRIRSSNAQQNLVIIRHAALNMLNQAKAKMKNMSVKRLRKNAGWVDSIMTGILQQ